MRHTNLILPPRMSLLAALSEKWRLVSEVKFPTPFNRFKKMSTDITPPSLTPEELALRKKQVRKSVLIRAVLLGLMVSAWWIIFVPEDMVSGDLKYILGVLAGLIAISFYLYHLRENVFGAAAKD